MSIQGVMNTAISGMQAQTTRLGVAASNIANSQTRGTGVNLENELLDIISAGIDFKANAAVFEAGADLWDVLKTIKRD